MADDKNKTASRHVLIDYTNHAGVRQQRTIVPDMGGIFFGSSEWHTEEQWLLNAFDTGKQAERTFAVAAIRGWLPADSREARVERSLAKQLQTSIEFNSRMVARLRKLQATFADPSTETVQQISSIIKDQEPT